jgi:hypothetical protein
MKKHDPKTCPTCGPYIDTEPYRRGEAKAKAAMALADKERER